MHSANFKDLRLAAHVTLALILTLSLAACGDSTAFRELDQTASPQNGSGDVVANTANTDNFGGGDAGSRSGGDDDGDGIPNAEDEDYVATDSDTDPDLDANGNGIPDSEEPRDPSSKTPEEKAKILVEDGGTLEIPGVKATRVGVNFEDSTDFDFNDAVLCFVGNFKIAGASVVSYQDQTVTAKTSSISGCQHRIDVRIVHEDGTDFRTSYQSNTTNQVSLPFRLKSKLEVTMTVNGGGCSRTPVPMTSTTNAIVKADECRTTGN